MKYVKTAMCLAVLGATLSSPMAWAVVTAEDRGSPHPDVDTKIQAKQHDWRVSQDVFWQGKTDGQKAECPANSAKHCKVQFKVDPKTTSTSLNWQVGAGANGATWFSKVQVRLKDTYQRIAPKPLSTAIFDKTIQLCKGMWAQPVSVQHRRWTKGVFQGGFVQTAQKPGEWTYDWKSNAKFGQWTDHVAVGKPYTTVMYSHKAL
jgi:hypothetical protein